MCSFSACTCTFIPSFNIDSVRRSFAVIDQPSERRPHEIKPKNCLLETGANNIFASTLRLWRAIRAFPNNNGGNVYPG